MAKTIKATHRLTAEHGVFYDPKRHFIDTDDDDAPDPGQRCTLPKGTHVIPLERELRNMPDRFQSLSDPEPPAEAEVEDDEGEGDGDDEDADGEPGDETEDDADPDAHTLVDEALAAVGGEWDALTLAQLEDLGDGYGIEASDIEGSGSGGNVLKRDWIGRIREARGA